MAKIKEINISNFRAYLGEHQFSFVGRNGISNLIVIYGPNGFGKTSFFDAVEFTLADSIRRFEHRTTKAEIDSRDYAEHELKLLSNRNTDKLAEVSIVMEDNKHIKRVAKRWKHKLGPYTDYKKGVLTTDLDHSTLQSFYNTNLLSQDQIDSFLRLRTPEEKFNELQEFWPEGEEAADVFRILSKYYRLLDSCLTETKKEVRKTNGEIAKFLNPNAKLMRIREEIDALNKSTLFALKYPTLKSEITEEFYLHLIDFNERNLKRISNRIAEYSALQHSVNALASEFPSYFGAQSNLAQEKKKFKKLSDAKRRYYAVTNLQKQKAENDKLSEDLLSSYRAVESLIADWPAHNEAISLILHLQNENSLGLRRTERALSQVGVFSESERTLQDSLQALRKTYNLAIETDNQLDALEAGLEKCERDQKDGLEILEFLEGEEARLNQEIARHQSYRYEIQVGEQHYLAEILPRQYRFLQTNYHKVQQTLKEITDELHRLNEQRDQRDSFAERLNSILEWGVGQVRTQKLSTCPMCNTRFDDVSALIAGIQSERETVLGASELTERITHYALIREILKDEEFLLTCQMHELATEVEQEISKEINAAFYDREQIYNRRADVESKVSYASSYFNKVIEELEESGLPAKAYQDNFAGLKKLNNDRIAKLKKSAERLEKVIQFKKNRQQLLESEITITKLQEKTNTNKIKMIEAEQAFQSFQASLNHFQLKPSEMNFEYLDAGLIHLKAKYQAVLAKADAIQHELTKHNAQLELYSVKYQAEVSELQLMEMSATIASLEEEVKTFRENYRLILDDQDYDLKRVTALSQNLQSRIEEHKKLKDDLERLTIELEVIRESLELAKFKRELSELEIKLNQTEVARNKVRLALIECGNFINLGIEQHFNKDVINRIYSKIEPHPNLKEIEIKSEISEGDKAAKLQIRAKNNYDRLNPILYFSTGQVNVLSLSIFLAKAFELGGDAINTIFMDDPVQNLSDINVLSFIDLLRTLIEEKDKQIVISTHDEKFFRLLQNKLSDDYFKAKYFELVSYGKVKDLI